MEPGLTNFRDWVQQSLVTQDVPNVVITEVGEKGTITTGSEKGKPHATLAAIFNALRENTVTTLGDSEALDRLRDNCKQLYNKAYEKPSWSVAKFFGMIRAKFTLWRLEKAVAAQKTLSENLNLLAEQNYSEDNKTAGKFVLKHKLKYGFEGTDITGPTFDKVKDKCTHLIKSLAQRGATEAVLNTRVEYLEFCLAEGGKAIPYLDSLPDDQKSKIIARLSDSDRKKLYGEMMPAGKQYEFSDSRPPIVLTKLFNFSDLKKDKNLIISSSELVTAAANEFEELTDDQQRVLNDLPLIAVINLYLEVETDELDESTDFFKTIQEKYHALPEGEQNAIRNQVQMELDRLPRKIGSERDKQKAGQLQIKLDRIEQVKIAFKTKPLHIENNLTQADIDAYREDKGY